MREYKKKNSSVNIQHVNRNILEIDEMIKPHTCECAWENRQESFVHVSRRVLQLYIMHLSECVSPSECVCVGGGFGFEHVDTYKGHQDDS